MKRHLVQGAHGEHGAVVGFDGLDKHRVSPDVNVSVRGSGENEVLGSTVTRRHHRLLFPQVPENPAFEGQTAACGTGTDVYKHPFKKKRFKVHVLSERE